ncbi:MAG: hypothetical protein HYV63_16650 [Candidatus Schekmanbacteria bacterium]|nr:hypothetical protein [Candidatus Schekmanbacteria bacterium]
MSWEAALSAWRESGGDASQGAPAAPLATLAELYALVQEARDDADFERLYRHLPWRAQVLVQRLADASAAPRHARDLGFWLRYFRVRNQSTGERTVH